jgi:hypothetical protein
MTDRIPSGMNSESWIERQLQEARDRGDFENLPGYGKPIPDLDRPYDELWWAREFIEREKLAVLPETLRLRRDIEVFKQELPAMPHESDVRSRVEELNDRILIANSRYMEGPPSTVWPLDPERIMDRWRRERANQPPRKQPTAGPRARIGSAAPPSSASRDRRNLPWGVLVFLAAALAGVLTLVFAPL